MTAPEEQHQEREGGGGARALASRVLARVEEQGAYASIALDAELSRWPGLKASEVALTTELLYGVLDCRSILEQSVMALVPRGGLKRDVKRELVLAAYQILFLDRVPDHAAVDEAVRAVKKRRGSRVAGFVNGVLRRLCNELPDVSRSEASLLSVPNWLRTRLMDELGEESARALLVGPGARLSCLRVKGHVAIPEWLRVASPCRHAPRAFMVAGDVRKQTGFSPAQVVVQEEGSQLVAHALEVVAGQRVLDACAGRGNKTTLLWERMGERGELLAVDQHAAKLDQLKEAFLGLGYQAPETLVLDWTDATTTFSKMFDAALVDAPCSGSGTMRRRPELRNRLLPEDVERLADLQRRILRAVLARVRPGGRVVYAVCSVLAAEGTEVVDSVTDLANPAPFPAGVVGDLAGSKACSLLLTPLSHGTDGYFLASLERC